MLRSIAAALLSLAGMARGAIFPDQIGDFKKGPPATIAVPDRPLYEEYGLDATEQAEYISPEKRFTATTWRFRDSTGALALFEARRPPAATPTNLSSLSVRTSDGFIFAYGNYVFQFTGTGFPTPAELDQLYSRLPKIEQSPLPALIGFLPSDDLVPNSERYVLGPVSLERFEPRIAPSVAGFHLGSEAQLGKYKTKKGLLTLAIFNYPTPVLARERASEFQKIPAAVVKRTGSLVAVTIAPPDPDAAERVLARVNYEANLTSIESPPVNAVKGMAKLLVDIFLLSGLLVLFSVIVGVGFGWFRIIARKMGRKEEFDAMIVLGLDRASSDK
jgi:uncharacterized protein DUF6599